LKIGDFDPKDEKEHLLENGRFDPEERAHEI
jgi:hypothetical protein